MNAEAKVIDSLIEDICIKHKLDYRFYVSVEDSKVNVDIWTLEHNKVTGFSDSVDLHVLQDGKEAWIQHIKEQVYATFDIKEAQC